MVRANKFSELPSGPLKTRLFLRLKSNAPLLMLLISIILVVDIIGFALVII